MIFMGGARSNLLSGLVAAWNFEEASGTAVDSFGGLDLTSSGATSSGAGYLSNARSLSGAANNWLYRTSPAEFLPGGADFFINVWTKLAATPADMCIASVYNSTTNNRCWRLRCNGTPRWNLTCSVNGTGATDLTYASVIPTSGAWYNIQAGKLGSTSFMRVNTPTQWGALESATLASGTLFASTADLKVGSYDVGSGSGRLNGLIDALSYHNLFLSNREQNQLWNSGLGRQYAYY